VTEQGIFDKKQLKLTHFYKETITYFTYAEDTGIQPDYMDKYSAVSQDMSAATKWEKLNHIKMKKHEEKINIKQENTKHTILFSQIF